jgi:hypothetical protein
MDECYIYAEWTLKKGIVCDLRLIITMVTEYPYELLTKDNMNTFTMLKLENF